MFNKSLASKSMLAIIAIIFTTFIIIGTILSLWFRNHYFVQRDESLTRLTKEVVKTVAEYKSSSNRLSFQRNLHLYADTVYADIYLVDPVGYVYFGTTDALNDAGDIWLPAEDLQKLINGEQPKLIGTYKELAQAKSLIHLFPIQIQNRFEGGIIYVTNLDYVTAPMNEIYKIIWISCFVAIMVSSIIINIVTREIIIKPLDEINSTVKKIEKGEVDKRAQVYSEDEIGQLAVSFNLMADSIEKADNKRREFISNVSHELRSPITSIKGFISGILDGIIPKNKESYYLNLANDEIQRLTRLINDLLDLSAMEEGKFKLVIERFNINELIKVCAIKFEKQVKEKKLKMKVGLEDAPIYVMSDKDRVTQVLTNLIDNSIKYSNDVGYIEINCIGKGDKAIVSIYNTGKTFSKEDMINIWDRFYKFDKSRTSKVSTGLGLSITRNILTQLNEEIWVENKNNNGVIFTFTLKRTY